MSDDTRIASLLSVSELDKSYGATRAIRGVSFAALGGRILAVLGENGAGKSTLVKILAGAVRPDAGVLQLDGTPLVVHSPRDALKQGIVLIPQELAYVPALSAAENVLLGQTTAKGWFSTARQIHKRAQPFLDRVGFELAPSTPMYRLSLGQKQLVEIAKALARDAKVLLLDEPTAALTAKESEILFATLERLKTADVISILISHRLDEVLDHADEILILRDGEVASFGPVGNRSKPELIADMLGYAPDKRDIAAYVPKEDLPDAVSITEMDLANGTTDPLTVSIPSGQIACFFGIRGAGHDAVVEMLAGLNPHTAGSLAINGRAVAPLRTPRAAAHRGIAYVPADRKKSGLVLLASISDNMSLLGLAAVSRVGFVSQRLQLRLAEKYAALTHLRFRDLRQPVWQLSGGNQQKVLIGSRLAVQPGVLVLHEPTRGVDLGARQQIHDLIRDLAAERGTAVVIATTDVDEAVELSQVAHVFRDGALTRTLLGQLITRDNLLLAAQSD